MKKKILVLGANGLVGSSIINFLSDKNFKITGIYNNKNNRLINKKNVKYIKYNLKNLKSVKKIFHKKKFDIIFNSAAVLKSDNESFESMVKLYNDNVNIQKNLLSEAFKKNIGLFIYFSSISIYEGIKKKKIKFDELHNYNLKSLYALSKICGERLLETATNSSNIHGVTLRLSGVHGIGRNNGVIYNMFNNAAKGKFIQINEPKSVFRLTFVDDINRAVYLIIKKKLKKKYSVYNIAGKEIYNLKKLAKIIIGICKKGKLNLLKNSQTRYQVLNINKFKKEYNFKPLSLSKKLKKYKKYHQNINKLKVD